MYTCYCFARIGPTSVEPSQNPTGRCANGWLYFWDSQFALWFSLQVRCSRLRDKRQLTKSANQRCFKFAHSTTKSFWTTPIYIPYIDSCFTQTLPPPPHDRSKARPHDPRFGQASWRGSQKLKEHCQCQHCLGLACMMATPKKASVQSSTVYIVNQQQHLFPLRLGSYTAARQHGHAPAPKISALICFIHCKKECLPTTFKQHINSLNVVAMEDPEDELLDLLTCHRSESCLYNIYIWLVLQASSRQNITVHRWLLAWSEYTKKSPQTKHPRVFWWGGVIYPAYRLNFWCWCLSGDYHVLPRIDRCIVRNTNWPGYYNAISVGKGVAVNIYSKNCETCSSWWWCWWQTARGPPVYGSYWPALVRRLGTSLPVFGVHWLPGAQTRNYCGACS